MFLLPVVGILVFFVNFSVGQTWAVEYEYFTGMIIPQGQIPYRQGTNMYISWYVVVG